MQHRANSLGDRSSRPHAHHGCNGIYILSSFATYRAAASLDVRSEARSYRLFHANDVGWEPTLHSLRLRHHLIGRVRSLVFGTLSYKHPHRTPSGTLAHLASGCKPQMRKRLATSIKALSVALLLVIFLFFTLGWVQTLNLIPAAQDAEQQEADLIHTLLNRGITHIYTDYWTCDRLAFESAERIICSVVDEQLQAGVNRYTPYTAIVNANSQASWVFPVGSPQARVFEQNMQKSGETNPSFIKDGYVIFMPITPTTAGQYKSEIAPRYFVVLRCPPASISSSS